MIDRDQVKKTCRGCRSCVWDKFNPAKMGICHEPDSPNYYRAVRTDTITRCEYWRPRQC